MAFSKKVETEILLRSKRFCALCRKPCGQKIELHHAVPKASGGSDTFDNCVPLCYDCHHDVGHYNTTHPRGKRYKPDELIRLRDELFVTLEEFGKPENDNIDYIKALQEYAREYDSSFNAVFLDMIKRASKEAIDSMYQSKSEGCQNVSDTQPYRKGLHDIAEERFVKITGAAKRLRLLNQDNYHLIHELLLGQFLRDDWGTNLGMRAYQDFISVFGYREEVKSGFILSGQNQLTEVKNELLWKYPKLLVDLLREERINDIADSFKD